MDLRQYWPQIGSSGEKPSDGEQWEYGDAYFAVHLNYLWNYLRTSFGEIEDWINDIENGDISIAEAEYATDANASSYKGNDIDSDGDGKVNTADHATEADYADEAGTANSVPVVTSDPSNPDDGDHWIVVE